jgi:macrolide transport system ATP-binding/permease protein
LILCRTPRCINHTYDFAGADAMNILTITNISKTYGLHQVLNQVSFAVNAGQRIGLVGANGVGKSTLLKIVIGEIEADRGAVALASGMKIGYLPQVIASFEGQTLADMIADSMRHLRQLEARMRQLEQQMGAVSGEALEAVMLEYGDVTEQFERYGGYEIDHRVDTVLAGLHVAHIPREQQFATLSGGEKSRVGLAMLLLQPTDVLLLDEPTNHLDFASMNWLEAYLQQFRGAILIVSHDRQFLNRTANVIVELDEHSRTARRYSGNYDAYHAAKLVERRKWETDYEQQQEEIKALRLEMKETARRNSNYRAHTDSDKYIRNAKIASHDRTVSRRVQAAEERLRRIEANPIPQPPEPLNFDPDFDAQALKGRQPVTISGVTKAFGARCVLDKVTFTLGAESRVVVVGPNGAGKSTLLKILIGLEASDSGEVYRNPGVRIGYLDQEGVLLDPEKTVLEALRDGIDLTEQQAITFMLRSGLFRYADMRLLVGQLSSGQQRKLQIARLIAGRANLLVLDEPTNYVSFDVLEGLEEALRHFPGPVIAASHDRRFIEHFSGQIWELQDGKLNQNVDTSEYVELQTAAT